MLETAHRRNLHWALAVYLFGRHRIEPESSVKLDQLTSGQVAPGSRWNSGDIEWADTDATQLVHSDPDRFHDLADDMVKAFVNDDLDENTFSRLAQNTTFVGNNQTILNFDAVANALHLPVVRLPGRYDMIFLGEAIFGMHDAVRDIAVVGEQKQTLSFTIKPTDRVNAFRNLDEIHDGPSLLFIARCRDKPAGLIQYQEAWSLWLEDLAINADFVFERIDAGSELGNGLAVHLDAAVCDETFGGPAGGDAASGKNALQSFAAWLSFGVMRL